MTSRSGSADVLDALGVRIDHDAASAGAALRDHGFAFMFAPNFHPAMKLRRADPARDRRPHGVQPGRAAHQSGRHEAPVARGRGRRGGGPHGRGRPSSWHGADLRDPRRRGRRAAARRQRAWPTSSPATASSATSSTPSALGFKRAATAKLSGGDPEDNARMTEAVLRGEPGARRDVVLLNAPPRCWSAVPSSTMEEGIERAALTIDAGLASELLETLREERRVAERPLRQRRPRPTATPAERAPGMTVADRPIREPRGARATSSRRSPRGAAPTSWPRWPPRPGPTDRGRLGDADRRGRSPNALPRPVSTSSPRSSARRRRPAGSRRRARTSSRGPAPTRPAARRRSRSCASRTGSAGRSTTCGPSGRPSPSRSWPRTSWSRRSSCRCSARPARTSSCCSPCSIPPGASPGWSSGHWRSAWSRWSRSTTRASSSVPSPPDARLIGLNNRDLRTLDVDVDQAARLRELVPDDRLVIAESGVREPGIVARWRALGFDGALVGEALVRATDPAAAARAFVAAGRRARRSGQRRAPAVREDLRHHRRGRGPRGGRAPGPMRSG